MGQRSLQERVGEMRFELDRLVKVPNGFVELLELQVNAPSIEIAVGVMRSDLKDVIEIPQGPVRLSQLEISLTAFLVAAGKIWIPLNDLEEVQDGRLELTGETVSHSSLKIGFNEVRPKLDRSIKVLNASLMLVEQRGINFPPTGEGLGKIRLKRDGLVEALNR